MKNANKMFVGIAVLAVVLFVLHNQGFLGPLSTDKNGEEKSSAAGYPCFCHGDYIGMMSRSRCHRKCTRIINREIKNL